MRHTLLVPLDGSPSSEVVLLWAAALARRRGLTILLARVTPWPPAPVTLGADYGSWIDLYGAVMDAQREDAEAYLESVRRHLIGPGLDVEAVVIEGDAATQILELADEHGAEAIALVTHGEPGWRRFLLGSVAERVVHHSPAPVLVVPADVERRLPAFGTVLVPLDGSRLGERAIDVALELGDRATRLLLLRHDGDGPNEGRGGPAWRDDESALAVSDPELYLTLLARRPAARQRATVLSRPARDWHQIVEAAAEHDADLIVMTLPPGGGPSGWISGSAADHLVRHADCPVLLVGPTALAARAAGRFTVGDLMHRQPLVLHGDDSLLTAIRELARRHVPAAPVVNGLGDVVGVVSEVDLLDWHVSLAGRLTRELAEGPALYLEHLARESVRKVMVQSTAAVADEATLESALARFGDRHIGCLPVTHDGRIVGTLYRADVLRALAHIRPGRSRPARTADDARATTPPAAHATTTPDPGLDRAAGTTAARPAGS